ARAAGAAPGGQGAAPAPALRLYLRRDAPGNRGPAQGARRRTLRAGPQVREGFRTPEQRAEGLLTAPHRDPRAGSGGLRHPGAPHPLRFARRRDERGPVLDERRDPEERRLRLRTPRQAHPPRRPPLRGGPGLDQRDLRQRQQDRWRHAGQERGQRPRRLDHLPVRGV
ncbi:MAG: hypothetical protein AVDCRST_MAG55-3037, partial [uncultured Rubrobacteraceae bacterium]